MRSKVFILTIFALMSATIAVAQKPFSVEDFEARPVTDASEDYFGLIRQIVGETVGYDEGDNVPTVNRSFSLRRLVVNAGEEETTFYESPLVVRSAEGWWFYARGKKHLALLLHVTNRQVKNSDALRWQFVLAVFRVRPTAVRGGGKLSSLQLVEAVDPRTDRFIDLPEELPLIQIGRKNQAFWIRNHHWNARENFRGYTPVSIGANNRLNLAIENLPGAYTSMDCSSNSDDVFVVEPLKRKPITFLPYDFVIRTLRWTKKQCEKRADISYPIEETRVFRVAWTRAKNRRQVLRARLVRTVKKRVKYVQGEAIKSSSGESGS